MLDVETATSEVVMSTHMLQEALSIQKAGENVEPDGFRPRVAPARRYRSRAVAAFGLRDPFTSHNSETKLGFVREVLSSERIELPGCR